MPQMNSSKDRATAVQPHHTSGDHSIAIQPHHISNDHPIAVQLHHTSGDHSIAIQPHHISNDHPIAVQLHNVSYKRGNQSVLNEVSVVIPAGQWIALAGCNGSGKSTLMRLIKGLLQADKGDIIIHGVPLQSAHNYDVRSQIGYIFPSPDDQFIGLTVRDDIAFGLENLCLTREEMEVRIQEVAKLLSLTSLLDRHPATLSGGQKQRAALAAVLAMKPSILILDEATSMLDRAFRKQFLDCLSTLRKEWRLTIMMISHDMKELLAADRLLMLHEGNILADGKPELLLKQQELLDACRLKTPYALELSRELKLQGVEIDECLDEQEVLTKLWPLLSSKFLIPTKTEH